MESALPYSCPSEAPLTPAVFSSCNSQSSLAWSACLKGANGLCSPSEGHHQSPSCPEGECLPFTPHLSTSLCYLSPDSSEHPKFWGVENLGVAAARTRYRKHRVILCHPRVLTSALRVGSYCHKRQSDTCRKVLEPAPLQLPASPPCPPSLFQSLLSLGPRGL